MLQAYSQAEACGYKVSYRAAGFLSALPIALGLFRFSPRHCRPAIDRRCQLLYTPPDMEPPPLAKQPWYTTRAFQTWALLGMVGALAVTGYLAIFVRHNDFLYHRRFGEEFLAGHPYERGCIHYLASRGMLNALTAFLPYRLDRALHLLAAIAALVMTLAWWNDLAGLRQPLGRRLAVAAALFSLSLAGAYVQRDLDECGLQLFLLFFVTAAARALSLGQSLRCGAWLGLAVAYKITPLLFFPYLLWKRAWRAAAWMAVFTVLWNLAPALYLGWDTTLACHRQWFAFMARNLAIQDPAQNGVESPHHVNQSLPLAIARALQTYPPGHPLAIAHPWFLQFGNLDAQAAKRGVQCVLLLIAALLAWRFRASWRAGDWTAEWATVTALCALLSPLCWLQHLVLILPCIFLGWRARLAGAALPRWQPAVMVLFALIALLVHRELMTRDLYEVMVSYKLHTLAALLAILIVLTLPQRRLALPVEDHASLTTPVRPARAA